METCMPESPMLTQMLHKVTLPQHVISLALGKLLFSLKSIATDL